MPLITLNHRRKWLSGLTSVKRSDTLTATDSNYNGLKFNVKVGQFYLTINKYSQIIYSIELYHNQVFFTTKTLYI